MGSGFRFIPIDPLWLAIVVSALLTLGALIMRVWLMQRFRAETTRVNRQQGERLRFLVAAYRSLAGSFTPATAEERHQVEAALSDVILWHANRLKWPPRPPRRFSPANRPPSTRWSPACGTICASNWA